MVDLAPVAPLPTPVEESLVETLDRLEALGRELLVGLAHVRARLTEEAS